MDVTTVDLLLKALLATVVIEGCVASFLYWASRASDREREMPFFPRGKWYFCRLLTVVLLVNFLTNPTINLILFGVPNEVLDDPAKRYSIVAALEFGVWVVESFLFYSLGGIRPVGGAILFAFALNATSYFCGDLMGAIGYWDWKIFFR